MKVVSKKFEQQLKINRFVLVRKKAFGQLFVCDRCVGGPWEGHRRNAAPLYTPARQPRAQSSACAVSLRTLASISRNRLRHVNSAVDYSVWKVPGVSRDAEMLPYRSWPWVARGGGAATPSRCSTGCYPRRTCGTCCTGALTTSARPRGPWLITDALLQSWTTPNRAHPPEDSQDISRSKL